VREMPDSFSYSAEEEKGGTDTLLPGEREKGRGEGGKGGGTRNRRGKVAFPSFFPQGGGKGKKGKITWFRLPIGGKRGAVERTGGRVVCYDGEKGPLTWRAQRRREKGKKKKRKRKERMPVLWKKQKIWSSTCPKGKKEEGRKELEKESAGTDGGRF